MATVETTGGLSIEEYALGLFNTWGVGHRHADDGVLLLVAAKDRKLRIQTGRGLGARLSDQRAKQIVDDHVVPRFQRGDYDGGVLAGVEAVRLQLGFAPGLTVPPNQPADDGSVVTGLVVSAVLTAIVGAVILVARRAARRGAWAGSPDPAHVAVPDGSSPGGGGGFGGGASSGGGASGGW